MIFEVFWTPEFREWHSALSVKYKRQVQARLQAIEKDGFFGPTNYFDQITELKWHSGLRVYLFRNRQSILVLFGGTKHGQDQDIRQAKRILYERLNEI